MNDRIELHNKLVKLMGNNRVYYQPPPNIKMEYPCILYFMSEIRSEKANNHNYKQNKGYNITIISKQPDHKVIDDILNLETATYDRRYISDNLYHDIIRLFI